MRLIKSQSLTAALLFLAALLVGLPLLAEQAQARGGGHGGAGFHGGAGPHGGFSGGSFRPEGRPPGGPPSGGPHPGGQPGGGAPPPGPRAGGPPPPPPHGNVTVTGGWGPYYGPGWGVAAGVAAGLAVGAVVATLPYAAERVVIAGQPYYMSEGTYYQPCYQGSDLSYCVVPPPQ